MRIKILSKKFYDTYSDCSEILKKETRPYACLTIELDGLLLSIHLEKLVLTIQKP